ncbi:PDZ domain-containing protein 7 isoform X2 [Dermacentor silvarum]|uniref:PDZ domain-containing protein 7 isoform X2 n=1 Tax=Dermacentor silvarum TaxID=543639 RepID=UPI002100829F|nr:PDZ domain-containing protein 7 isoform X2 [Dermacentor silvarum]
MSAVALSPDAPAIRLCHVVKWPDYEGFGFNLHSEKSKPGQYLGKIDEGSPAQLAGLREGDRIVEVNGINISNENHKQVVERIKAVPNETKLLVVDPLADAWYKEHKIIIKSSLPTVKQCHNPVPRPGKRNSGASLGSSSSSSDQPPRRGSSSSSPPAAPSKVVSLPAGAPAARLCHLVRRPDFDGYGFNLHADKQRKLQYVGAVDPGSPAEAAGLRANDTIVEVNGVNVEGANHRDIVERIKAVPNETRLLVVDDGSAAWYREHGVAIHGDLPNVIQLSSVKAAARRASKPAAVAQQEAAPPPSEVTGHDGLRLCHLSKWPNFDGYGFNLHADKKRQGHFIGQVDPGSPAELGGLRKNDRLVEVNGLSVEGESHREIIERIKQDPTRVSLLVIDREADEAFARRKQKPSSQSESVVRRHTPAQQPGTEQQQQQQQQQVNDLSKSSTPLLTPSPQSTPPQATERASHVATATSAAQQSRDEDDTSSVEVVAASPTPTSEEEGDDRSTPRLETPVSDKGSSAVNGGGSRSSDLRSSTSSSPRDSPVFARDQKSSVIESTTTTTVIKNTTLTTGADRTDGSGSYDVQKAYDVQINNSEVRRISDLQPPPQRGGAVLAPPQPAARQAAVVHVENNGTSQNGAAAPVRNGGSLPPPGADGLNLTMKASELRELLRSRKKKDPRETQMDLRQKYKIIEQM